MGEQSPFFESAGPGRQIIVQQIQEAEDELNRLDQDERRDEKRHDHDVALVSLVFVGGGIALIALLMVAIAFGGSGSLAFLAIVVISFMVGSLRLLSPDLARERGRAKKRQECNERLERLRQELESA